MNNKPYGWVIDFDHINEKENSAVGIVGPSNILEELLIQLNQGKGTVFKLYDDDENLYYTGRVVGAIEEEYAIFGPLDDFGLASGCTLIAYKTDGEWHYI